MRRILSLLPFLVLAGFLWFYREPFLAIAHRLTAQVLPCRSPILYSLGEFDSRFGLSQAEFLSDVQKAEEVWESAAGGRNLFQYATAQKPGYLMINLVYDERQAATDRLKSLGYTIDESRKTYDALAAKYESEKAQYERAKAALETMIAAYNKDKASYESKVAYWNARGGAPRATYLALQAERKELDAEVQKIKTAEANLNAKAEEINALVVTLNRLAADLNLTAEKYNDLGDGSEFEEGIYKSSLEGQEIDIYQFDNQEKLVRVLAHELGHALGLEHNDDPNAIMYRLNQAKASEATPVDVASLKKRCGL